MENACAETPEAIREALGTGEGGLTAEAVEAAREEHGRNELPPEEGTSLLTLIIEQFQDALVLILLVSMAVSFVLAFFETNEEEKLTAFFEPLTILVILVVNATVGVLQTRNAESAVEALKSFQAENAVVIRDGVTSNIPAAELVPGDLIEVAVGQQVPADARMIEQLSAIVKTDQALLTGESEPVIKDTELVTDAQVLQDKSNVLFSGTNVTRGKARCIVVQTGPHTEMGKVNAQVSESKRVKSPMEIKMEEFAKLLTKMIAIICVFIFAVNIPNFKFAGKGNTVRGALAYFKVAVSLAVAAIPEGLPAVITTCYSLGVSRLAKRNAIMRFLPSVETLGCTSVICSDKTGTLTTNQMSVIRVAVVDARFAMTEYAVEGTSYRPEGALSRFDDPKHDPIEAAGCVDEGLQWVAKIGSLCNDASLSYNAEARVFEKIGEPTEAALVVLAEKIGLPDEGEERRRIGMEDWNERVLVANSHWREEYEKLATMEFTRSRKSMSVLVRRASDRKTFLFVKGAYERVVERCSKYRTSDGQVHKMNAAMRRKLAQQQRDWTGPALRCLALAYKENAGDVDEYTFDNADTFEGYEKDMVFAGGVGIMDPPREEVQPAIADCKTAGIRVIMCTGDNKNTAVAICRNIGIFERGEEVEGKAFTGAEFVALDEAGRAEAARVAKCFARVEPAHKQILVRLLQDDGQVVAMTGDGINDSPALKAADIGVAMGTGTSVARGAAAMILTDDNFCSIVGAVDEGRAIFNNTKAFIRYLITSNIGEVIAVATAAILGLPEVLLSVQLLFVNLVTDGLPATALSFNKAEPNTMMMPPRRKDEPIVNRETFLRYLTGGMYVGLAVIAAALYYFMIDEEGPQITFWELRAHHRCEGEACAAFESKIPMTMSLSVLVFVEMLCAISAVSNSQSLLVVPPWQNIFLVGSVLLSGVMHYAVLEIPFLQTIFSTTHLSAKRWNVVILLCLPVLLIEEMWKFLNRAKLRSSAPAAVGKA